MTTVNTLASAAATPSQSSSKADGASKSLAQDFDQFLALLTTQLQYQDPLEPLDSNQFTEQLVQFTGVEQQITQNKNLETLISLMQTEGLATATALLGQEVVANSSTARMGTDGISWHYDLGASSAQTQLTVRNASGTIVHQTTGERSPGEHRFSLPAGSLPSGNYTLSVDALTTGGLAVGSSVFLKDKVQSIEITNGQSQLLVGGVPLALSDISRVTDTGRTQTLTEQISSAQ